MKVKLYRKLRKIGLSQITVYSIAKTNGVVTGMSYGMDSDEYRGLFEIGDTENDIKEKAFRIYLRNNIDSIRRKYRKYTRRYKYRNSPENKTS